jgi:hypothetical protein
MPIVGIIIPARNEPYLTKTVDDVFAKARGDIRVYVALEGYYPREWDKTTDKYPGRLITIHHGQPHGMRSSINQCANIAIECDHLMKTDAHCQFSEGFDEILKRDCPSKTVMVPRRLRLDPEKWEIMKDGRPPVDYEYIAYPNGGDGGMKGRVWEQRARDRAGIMIDDLMCAQGSCWFMPRSYFYELDLMDEANYGSFWKEMLEISLKAWLSGGKMLVNKNVWYGHWHKDRRGYSMEDADLKKAVEYSNKWLTDESGWKKQIRPIWTLIQQFNPPGWPEDYYRMT